MFTEDEIKALHEFARTRHKEVEHLSFDRKLLRWNDIVDMGVFYSECSTTHPSLDVAKEGILDAIMMCCKDDEGIYVPKSGPKEFVAANRWMRPS